MVGILVGDTVRVDVAGECVGETVRSEWSATLNFVGSETVDDVVSDAARVIMVGTRVGGTGGF